MADNVTVIGVGADIPVATDNIGGYNFQRVKVTWGPDGTASDTDTGAALPVQLRNSTGTELGVAAAPLQVSLANTAANATAVKVDGSAVTQPVSDAGGSLTVDNGGTFAVQAAQSGTWNVTNVSGTVSLPTGASTLAEQQSQTTKLTAIQTSVELIDDSVATLGTTTYTEATSKGLVVGAVRRDADTTLVNTTNEVGPLQMDANGRLKVEAFSGEALPVTDNSGSLTVDAPVATPVFVRLSDGAAAITTLPVSLASVPSHAVTNAGTFAVQAAQSGTWNVGTVTAVTAISNALPAGTNLLGITSSPAETSAVYNGSTALTPKFASIAASTSGNNTIVSAVVGKKIRILALQLVANAAVNAKWQSGAGGTDLTGLAYLAANGGYVLPFNPVGWFETASNTLLNLNLSGAIAVGGSATYIEV